MSGHTHKAGAIVVGSESPAVSISWDDGDGFFIVFYSDSAYPDEGDEDDAQAMCLGCLIAEGDVQVGAGLDLAREHGQVDWDGGAAEWRVVALADR